MRKLLLTFVAITVMGTVWATNKERLTFNKGQNDLKVENITTSGFSFNLKIGEAFLKNVESKSGDYFIIQTTGFTKSFNIGNPNLPTKGKLIEVPFGAKVDIKVISEKFEIIDLSTKGFEGKILPCQPSVAKCDDGKKTAFKLNEDLYAKDAFYANELVKYEESGVMRGSRMGRIEMNPFQYNPVKNQLKVYTELTVEVTFKGADMPKTERMKDIYGNGFFNNMLTKTMNYTNDTKALNQNEPVKMLIIADRMFENSLVDFVDWKNMTGIETTVRYTDEGEVGSTTTSIQAFLQGVYDAATAENPAPSFILLAGDIQQVPTFDGTSGGHVSDLYYFTYDGPGDLIPDVNYGRFSAQTVAEMDIIIEKTLLYEKYEMTDPSYLDNVVLVAGDDATYEMRYGNGAIRYINDIYLNEQNGLTPHVYLQNPPTGESNATYSADIIQNISDGVSWGNYTAHCSSSGWATPAFTKSDIPNLQNSEKYGLLIGNCCLSNKFDDNECFGEALLRTADKGAIGYLGGSNSTYWDEDYWWATGNGNPAEFPNYEDFGNGSYDLLYHENITDQPVADWAPTQSQVNLAGLLAVEESSSTRKTYYWEIYHLMGDPSLMPWIGVPDAITPGYLSSIPVGLGSLDINGLPGYARVALSDGGTLISSAVADANGNLTLEFTPFSNPTTANLVITAQWHQPYIGALDVVTGGKPFVVLNQTIIDDAAGNGNGMADYGETIKLDVNLKNVAEAGSGYDANDIKAMLSSQDPYITIKDNIDSTDVILAGDSVDLNDAYEIQIANNAPDNHQATLTLTMNGTDKYIWESSTIITINSPLFEIGEMTLSGDNDANDRLDPGETANISFTVNNIGHADATDVIGILTGDSQYFTVTDSVKTNINSQGSATFTFNVVASTGAPQGSPVNLTLNVSKSNFSATTTKDIIIGQPAEIGVGDGNENTTYYPFYTYYENNRSQMLYLGSEIGVEEINIQELALNFTTIGSEAQVKNLSIKFLETNLTALGTSFQSMTAATEVFSAATYIMPDSTGWNTFDITDFTYNPNNNLIIEIVWGDNNSFSQPSYTIEATNTANTSVVYGFSDTEAPPTYDNNSTIRPNIMLYIEQVTTSIEYSHKFKVNDGVNPIENATVTVGGLTINTDSEGNAVANLYEGDYYYTVSAEGFETTNSTPLNVTQNDSSEVQLTPIEEFNITFTVTDGTNPLENATVYFDLDTSFTNSNGQVVFNCYEGTYQYSAKKNGYHSFSTKDITVNQDESVSVILDPIPMYSCTFVVTDGENPIENATVTFNSTVQTTNSSGQSVFSNVAEGVYYYTIEATGYESVVDEPAIIDKNSSMEIVLTTVGIGYSSSTSNLKLYPNPTNGNITIELPFVASGATAVVLDLTGKTIVTQQFESATTTVDLSNVSEGIYIIKVQNGINNYTDKIIIK